MTEEQKTTEIVDNSHYGTENDTKENSDREMINSERYAGLSSATKKILEKGTVFHFR